MRRLLIPLLLLLLLILASPGVHPARAHMVDAAAKDVHAITQAVYGSQLALQTLCIPPPAYRASVKPVPAALLASLTARIHSVLAKYYTGERLDQLERVLDSSCGSTLKQGAEERETGGGVDSLRCEVDIQIDVATASCTAVAWNSSIIRTPNEAGETQTRATG